MFLSQLHLVIFLPPRAWARKRQPLSRPNTVDTWQGGPSLKSVSDLRSVWMRSMIILIYSEVYFLYVITCYVEIVTPSGVFINHLLSTAMAMLSNKWKSSYDSKRKHRRQ